MSKELGSLTFRTSVIRTDEFMLLASCMRENGNTKEESILHINFIDDCLTMRRLCDTYGKTKNALFTPTGRRRKHSTFADFISTRLDNLVSELKNVSKPFNKNTK